MPFAPEEGARAAPAADQAADATQSQADNPSSPDATRDDAAPANAQTRPHTVRDADDADSPDADETLAAANEAVESADDAEPESAEDSDASHDADAPDGEPAPADEDESQAEQSERADQAEQAEPSGPAAREAETAATVEAVLFTADSPLPAAKVAQIARLPLKAVRAAITALNDRYHQVGAAFRIEEIAGGFQMLTLGQYRDVLERLHSARSDSRLTQAALEALAVVAYRQPVLRADVESIRGVACGEVLRGLMEKQLIHIAGRAQILGRPLLYGTTRRFLELFGLASLEDLPKAEELRAPTQKLAAETPAVASAPAASESSAQAAPSDPAAPLASPATSSEEPADADGGQATEKIDTPEGQYVPQPQSIPSQASE